MIVNTGYAGKYKKLANVRLSSDNKAVWSIDLNDVPSHFLKILYYDKTYTPADGAKYLKVLTEAFSNSSTIAIELEEDKDTWYKTTKL